MSEEITVLKKCLLSAGKVLCRYFSRISYDLKGPSNLLTKADIQSQKTVLKIITKNFPDHDFLAEENEERQTGSRYLWIIDPLDGTTNYAHTFPVACTSIGLLKDKKLYAGGIYDPFRKELFLAVKGKGAELNGKKISVSKTSSLKDSLLLTGFPYDRALNGGFYCGFYLDFIKICHDVRRSGSAALDMAWTAAGRVDGFWEFKLNPWDVSAGRLLIEEAGGKVTDFNGRQWAKISSYGAQNLASNGLIHSQMLKIIRKRLQTNSQVIRMISED